MIPHGAAERGGGEIGIPVNREPVIVKRAKRYRKQGIKVFEHGAYNINV
jgi:hypothetical protein